MPAVRQKRPKQASTACHASSMRGVTRCARDRAVLFMALPSFKGIDTRSLRAQGEQRRSVYFNIDRDIPGHLYRRAYRRLAYFTDVLTKLVNLWSATRIDREQTPNLKPRSFRGAGQLLRKSFGVTECAAKVALIGEPTFRRDPLQGKTPAFQQALRLFDVPQKNIPFRHPLRSPCSTVASSMHEGVTLLKSTASQ